MVAIQDISPSRMNAHHKREWQSPGLDTSPATSLLSSGPLWGGPELLTRPSRPLATEAAACHLTRTLTFTSYRFNGKWSLHQKWENRKQRLSVSRQKIFLLFRYFNYFTTKTKHTSRSMFSPCNLGICCHHFGWNNFSFKMQKLGLPWWSSGKDCILNAWGPGLTPGGGTRYHMPQLEVCWLKPKIPHTTTKTQHSQITFFQMQKFPRRLRVVELLLSLRLFAFSGGIAKAGLQMPFLILPRVPLSSYN